MSTGIAEYLLIAIGIFMVLSVIIGQSLRHIKAHGFMSKG
jgi:hypothetical protein